MCPLKLQRNYLLYLFKSRYFCTIFLDWDLFRKACIGLFHLFYYILYSKETITWEEDALERQFMRW